MMDKRDESDYDDNNDDDDMNDYYRDDDIEEDEYDDDRNDGGIINQNKLGKDMVGGPGINNGNIRNIGNLGGMNSVPVTGKGVKHVQEFKDQPFDLAYEINDSVEGSQEIGGKAEINSNSNIKKNSNSNNNSDFEEDEDDLGNIGGIGSGIGTGSDPYKASESGFTNSKPLPKFDMSQFFNIEADGEVKDLMKMMNK